MPKRSVTLLFLLVMTFAGCSCDKTLRKPEARPCRVMIPLSQDLIEKYITSTLDADTLQQFYNLRFHLEKELILKFYTVKETGRVMDDHRLKLKQGHDLKELNFPPRVQGRLVNMYKKDDFPWGEDLILQVEFDEPLGMVLTFVPEGKWGTFVVAKSMFWKKVMVNGVEYTCSWSCDSNRLLVPICLLEKFNINRHVARGFYFPQ